MAGITLDQAQAMLTTYLAAEQAVLAGQSYTIQTTNGTRTLTRANLADIVSAREAWEAKVNNLTRKASGGSRTRYLVG
jgi:phosphosulfolactate phosphohydrolase-like enzyme